MTLSKHLISPGEQRVIENQVAVIAQQRADIDYLAMMVDVELESEEAIDNEL